MDSAANKRTMTISISNWSGRTGNNIQQVANAIMYCEITKSTFSQVLEHDLINKFSLKFGENNNSGFGRFYSWQPIVNCLEGTFSGENETGLEIDYIYKNIRRICKEYIFSNLNLEEKKIYGDDTIVIHLRSGDVYKGFNNYVPNPLIYYLNLIESFEKCLVITEPDMDNPIINELKKIDKVVIQSSSVKNDFSSLVHSKNVALSGVGTFAVAAALCSPYVKNLYTTDLLLTEHLNYSMLFDTDINVHIMELKNYIPVFPCSWKNTEEQHKFILEYTLPE